MSEPKELGTSLKQICDKTNYSWLILAETEACVRGVRRQCRDGEPSTSRQLIHWQIELFYKVLNLLQRKKSIEGALSRQRGFCIDLVKRRPDRSDRRDGNVLNLVSADFVTTVVLISASENWQKSNTSKQRDSLEL